MQIHRMRPVAVAGAVVVLDQATKWLVRQTFPYEGAGREVIPGLLNLCYIRNTGAAWGLLSGWQTFLVVFSLSAMALLVWRRHALLGDLPWRWLVLGLLLGGICGNLIDRVWLRYVVDFIDFYYGRAHFPAFNVADASICVGVGLFMLLQWREERRRKRQPVNIEP
ncbi:MAG: signal peptidase II [bacterium]